MKITHKHLDKVQDTKQKLEETIDAYPFADEVYLQMRKTQRMLEEQAKEFTIRYKEGLEI